MSNPDLAVFNSRLWEFYSHHGRDLPWRHDPTPYQVVVSEIMLQQTQVARIVERYPQWLERFPTFEALATAELDDVLRQWQGLGYNRRGLWLQKIAQAVVNEYDSVLPNDPRVLMTLPGIGTNTAGSIVAFAYNLPVVFIETNIRRVFLHEFFAGESEVEDTRLLPLIEDALDRERPREWYYALMDYGAHLARTVSNPNRRSRHYSRQSSFEGSLRQLRGEVLRRVLNGEALPEDERVPKVLVLLEKDGLIKAGIQYH